MHLGVFVQDIPAPVAGPVVHEKEAHLRSGERVPEEQHSSDELVETAFLIINRDYDI